MVALSDYFGSVSGENGVKDKLAYDVTWGSAVKAPMLNASPCVVECRVSHSHQIGISHTFLGEVVSLHMDAKLSLPDSPGEAVMQWYQDLDMHDVDPLVYHSYPLRYYRVGEKL